MNKPRIAKAGFKDNLLVVELHGYEKDTERRTTVTAGRDKCHPDLDAAFAKVAPEVREILEWPSNLYKSTDGKNTDRIRVTGVSWSHSETTNVEGACIILQVDLETSNSPLCVTTPHLPFDQYAEGGEQPVMPDAAQDALNALKAEVQKFLDGKRAQGDLFAQEVLGDTVKAVRELAVEHGIPISIADQVALEEVERRVTRPRAGRAEQADAA